MCTHFECASGYCLNMSTLPSEQLSELNQLIDGWHHDPHSVLGAHSNGTSTTIRVLRPWAKSVMLLAGNHAQVMTPEHRGTWIATLPVANVTTYSLAVDYGDGPVESHDPFRFAPSIGELDLHLIGEGRHEELWTALGAHTRTIDGVAGVGFTVWAPNAQGVRVVGDFNFWDGLAHPMRSMGGSGVWEIFIPSLGAGEKYKFSILGRDGQWRTKADPMAFAAETAPATSSIVFESSYTWNDDAWMQNRATKNPLEQPMSTYEVHLGSWRKDKNYRELIDELVPYVRDHGFTHVEFMPIAEHPYSPSWGYQVTSYYAPTSRFGNPDDFRALVDAFHQAGIAVIVDWVPAHFPKDEWALAQFDGTALYEHPDPRRGEQPDWGTLVFDFGRKEVKNFLVANASYWLEEYHIDGLRVDAVASMLYLDYSRNDGEWVPNHHGGRENLEAVALLQEMNATVYRRMPGIITIAEESTAWPGVSAPTEHGGLGFGMKWNMGWMHDSLSYMKQDPINRKYHHHEMTFAMVYAWTENFVLPLSHDEVVHGKGSLLNRMPGDHWQKLANLRAYFAYMWAHPGKKLLFMGGEFGQPAEWSEARGLDWWLLNHQDHQGVAHCIGQLNDLYRSTTSLWTQDHKPEGFEWLVDADADANVLAWARHSTDGSTLISITNFSPVVRDAYTFGVPHAGVWTEVLNTDAHEFGGSGVGNQGSVTASQTEINGKPASLTMTLAPLATMWLIKR